jgi:hypothetical protein
LYGDLQFFRNWINRKKERAKGKGQRENVKSQRSKGKGQREKLRVLMKSIKKMV